MTGARFEHFGPIEVEPLSKIQKIGGDYLAKTWITAPHVTHHDTIDVEALENYRADLNQNGGRPKLTPLPFVLKAVTSALKAFPRFNASLDETGKNVVLKKYYNIGVVIDTPRGVLIGVVKSVDTKPVDEIAATITALSEKARGRGLPMSDMEGGSFSVSSLGDLGGTGFTPIINAPEVAMLGISRRMDVPVKRGMGLEWRRELPVSLSYDHRVVNGADAGRFLDHLRRALANPEALH